MKVLGLLLGLVASSFAADPSDSLRSPGTIRVAQTNGDTIGTYTVKCNFNSVNGAALLKAAVTDRSRRRICFENSGNITVIIGSSTVMASNLFVLGESTNTATSPRFCTNSSAAFYCHTTVGASSMTVVAIEETQSTP